MNFHFKRYDYAVFLGYITYAGSSVGIPVLLADIAVSLDLPLENGGMGAAGALHAARSATMLATMLFCPLLAAKTGLRRMLGWSFLLLGVSMGCCSAVQSYGQLLALLLLAGLGEGVLEALISPAVQDLHADEEPERYMNLTHGFWSVGVLSITLLCAAIIQNDWSWRPALLLCGLLSVPSTVMLLAKPLPGHVLDRKKPGNWRDQAGKMAAIFRCGAFYPYLLALFFCGGAEWCLTYWCASFLRLHFGATPWTSGIGMALFATGMMLARFLSGAAIPGRHLLKAIAVFCLLGAVTGSFLPFAETAAGAFPLIFLSGLFIGPLWPSLQSSCVRHLPHLDETSIYVLLSCSGIPGCGVFTLLQGMLSDGGLGFAGSFLLIPAALLASTLCLAFALWNAGKKPRATSLP